MRDGARGDRRSLLSRRHWHVRDREQFRRNFPGYTMGDAGAAAIVVRSDDDRGIFYRRFVAISRHWDLATIASGGSLNPRGTEHAFLRPTARASSRRSWM